MLLLDLGLLITVTFSTPTPDYHIVDAARLIMRFYNERGWRYLDSSASAERV